MPGTEATWRRTSSTLSIESASTLTSRSISPARESIRVTNGIAFTPRRDLVARFAALEAGKKMCGLDDGAGRSLDDRIAGNRSASFQTSQPILGGAVRQSDVPRQRDDRGAGVPAQQRYQLQIFLVQVLAPAICLRIRRIAGETCAIIGQNVFPKKMRLKR